MTDFSLSQMTYATGTSKPRKRRLVDPMFEVDEGLNLKPVDDDVLDKDSDEGASSMKSEQDSDSLLEAKTEPDLQALITRLQKF